MSMKEKAVMYARVSSASQEKEGFSIPAQIDLLNNYAENHDIEVVKIFEEAETAKKAGRTKFNEMLKYLSKNKDVTTILVEKTDRLYRNFKDYVELDVDRTGYKVCLVKEGVVLCPQSNSHEKLVHGLKVLLAKNFIDNLREETQKGRLKKASEGYFIGQVPYGYKKLDPRTTVIDEEKAPFIRRAFELYSEGCSVEKVRHTLKEEGYIYNKSSMMISKGHLHKMLKNVSYIGIIDFKGKFYEGHHEPIISNELFNKVQIQFKKDSKPDKMCKHKFAFSGMITCAKCGCAVTAEIKKGRYIYYHCTGYKKTCNQKESITEEKLIEQFDSAVKAVTISEKHYEYIKQGLRESFIDKKKYDEEHYDVMVKQVKQIKIRLDKLYLDKLDGEITTEMWREKHAKWSEELETLQAKITAYSKASKKYYEEGIKYIELLKNAYQMYSVQTNFEKSRLLKTLLSNCTLKDGKLSYIYNKPFCYFVKNDHCRKKYPGCDSNA